MVNEIFSNYRKDYNERASFVNSITGLFTHNFYQTAVFNMLTLVPDNLLKFIVSIIPELKRLDDKDKLLKLCELIEKRLYND